MLKQRNDPVRLLWRRIVIGFLLLLICSAIWAVWGVFWKEQASAQMRAEAEAQLSDLQGRKSHLTTAVTRLQTDRGKEELLREQYDMGKAGEQVIQIVDPDDASSSSTPATTTVPQTKGTFSWW